MKPNKRKIWKPVDLESPRDVRERRGGVPRPWRSAPDAQKESAPQTADVPVEPGRHEGVIQLGDVIAKHLVHGHCPLHDPMLGISALFVTIQ